MSNVLINKLNIEIEYKEFSNRFIICQCSTSEKYIKYGAMFLDEILVDAKALAVVHESGKSFYILFTKDKFNESVFATVLANSKYATLKFEKIFPNNISKNLIVQLLMNSLSSYSNESLAFNNVTGKLYCTSPSLYKRTKDGKVKQIVGLEMRVTKDLLFAFDLKTFTSIEKKNRLVFKKRKLQSYPKYSMGANENLVRVENEGSQIFIVKQFEGEKNNIEFINFSSEEKFQSSKCGLIVRILELFNRKYHSIAKISFIEESNFEAKKFNPQFFYDTELSLQKVNIVLKSTSFGAQDFLQKLVECMRRHYKVVEFSDDIVDDENNIVVVNEKKYYKENLGIEDSYMAKTVGKTVQHLTVENFKLDKESAIGCVVKELAIKNEIKRNKFLYLNWSSFDFVSDIYFYIFHYEKCYGMKIDREGNFAFSEIERNCLINNQKDSSNRVLDYFELLKKEYGDKVECVISYNEGLCAILEIGIIPLPKIFEISEKLQKETEEHIFSSQDIITILSQVVDKNTEELKRIEIKLQSIDSLSKSDVLQITKSKSIKKKICELIEKFYGITIKTYFRDKKYKYDYFSSNMFINFKKEENGKRLIYYVGEKLDNIQTYFSCACPMRAFVSENNNYSLWQHILGLLNVDYVRNKQLTVVPFPIKYLREYISQVYNEDEDDSDFIN